MPKKSNRVRRSTYITGALDGLRLFREERLEDAIEQWRGVLELDSKHLDARRSLDQAEKILRTLAAQQKR